MLKATPHPQATPINASQSPTFYYLEPVPAEKDCPCSWSDNFWCHRWPNAYRPPLHLESVQGVNAYSSHSIHWGRGPGGWGGGGFKPTKPRRQLHKAKGIGYNYKGGWFWAAKGVATQDVRGWFYNRTRRDHEGDHGGLRFSLGLVPNYVVLVFTQSCVGSTQWTWASAFYARLSHTRPRDWFKKANGFDFEHSSNISIEAQ